MMHLREHRGDAQIQLERRFIPMYRQITAYMAIPETSENGQY